MSRRLHAMLIAAGLVLIVLGASEVASAGRWDPIPFPDETPEETPSARPLPDEPPGPTPAPQASMDMPDGPRRSLFGRWEIRGAWDAEDDRALEDRVMAGSRIDLGLEAKLSHDLSARLGGRLDGRYHEATDRSEAEMELREAMITWRTRRLDLKLGSQIVEWGRAESLAPTDLVNPRDLREPFEQFLARDQETRIPVLAARSGAYLGPFRMDLVWAPLFEPARYELVGSNWALFRLPGYDLALDLEELPDAFERYREYRRLEDLLLSTDDSRIADLNRFYRATEYPADDFVHGDVAARAGLETRWADIHFLAASHSLDLPTVYLPSDVREMIADGVLDSDEFLALLVEGRIDEVEAVFERVTTFGADLAFAIGPVTVSYDGTYTFEHPVYNTNWRVRVRDLVLSNFGLDILLPDGTTLGLQSHQTIVVKNPSDSRLDDVESLVTAFLRRAVWGGRLELELRGVYDADDEGFLLAPEIRIHPWDALELDLAYHLFDGDGEDLFASWEPCDQAFARLVLSF